MSQNVFFYNVTANNGWKWRLEFIPSDTALLSAINYVPLPPTAIGEEILWESGYAEPIPIGLPNSPTLSIQVNCNALEGVYEEFRTKIFKPFTQGQFPAIRQDVQQKRWDVTGHFVNDDHEIEPSWTENDHSLPNVGGLVTPETPYFWLTNIVRLTCDFGAGLSFDDLSLTHVEDEHIVFSGAQQISPALEYDLATGVASLSFTHLTRYALEQLNASIVTTLTDCWCPTVRMDKVFNVTWQNNSPSEQVYLGDCDSYHDFAHPQIHLINLSRFHSCLVEGVEIIRDMLLRRAPRSYMMFPKPRFKPFAPYSPTPLGFVVCSDCEPDAYAGGVRLVGFPGAPDNMDSYVPLWGGWEHARLYGQKVTAAMLPTSDMVIHEPNDTVTPYYATLYVLYDFWDSDSGTSKAGLRVKGSKFWEYKNMYDFVSDSFETGVTANFLDDRIISAQLGLGLGAVVEITAADVEMGNIDRSPTGLASCELAAPGGDNVMVSAVGASLLNAGYNVDMYFHNHHAGDWEIAVELEDNAAFGVGHGKSILEGRLFYPDTGKIMAPDDGRCYFAAVHPACDFKDDNAYQTDDMVAYDTWDVGLWGESWGTIGTTAAGYFKRWRAQFGIRRRIAEAIIRHFSNYDQSKIETKLLLDTDATKDMSGDKCPMPINLGRRYKFVGGFIPAYTNVADTGYLIDAKVNVVSGIVEASFLNNIPASVIKAFVL